MKSIYSRSEKFDLQLSKALICERRLAEVFAFGSFDTTLELKSESYQWRRTGNIAIEYRRNGKPSGISTTQAHYWVHELCDDADQTLLYLVVPMSRMKELAREAVRAGKFVKGCGDDNLSDIALIDVASLLTLAKATP